MLSLQEISDRMELERLTVDYAYAIDERAFDRLDAIFTPDAYIDYRAMGGIDGRYPDVKVWLSQALAAFPHYMHLNGNFTCDIHGDTATGKIGCFNPMVVPNPAGGPADTMFLGLWYLDKYVRTPKGWRISERVETKSYDYNMPEWMKVALKIK